MKQILSLAVLLLSLLSCSRQETLFSMEHLLEINRDTVAQLDGRTYMLVSYSDTTAVGRTYMCLTERSGQDSVVHQISGIPVSHELAADGHTLTLTDLALSRDYDLKKLPAVIEFEPFSYGEAYRTDTLSFPAAKAEGASAQMKAVLTLPVAESQHNVVMQRIYSIVSEDCAMQPSAFPSPRSVVEHAYQKLEMQAHEEMDDSVLAQSGIVYDRYVEVKPLWHSADGKLETWKVDEYFYAGGAHGSPLNYYLTYRAGQTQPLGLAEIFNPSMLGHVFNLISEKLKARYVKAYGNLPEDDSMWNTLANYDEGADKEGLCSGILYDHFGGKAYPRPSLTDRGVAFVYQVYEKDCYAAGPVCILLPWNEIKAYLQITDAMQCF